MALFKSNLPPVLTYVTLRFSLLADKPMYKLQSAM